MKEEQQLEVLYGMVQKSLERLDEASERSELAAREQSAAGIALRELASKLQHTVKETTQGSIALGVDKLSGQVAQSVGEAGEKTAASLAESDQAARIAVRELNAATRSFRRSWWRITLGATMLGISGVMVAGYLMSWWMRADIESMQAERRSLAADIASLKKTSAQWEAKLGKAEVTTCKSLDDRQHLCVRVDEEAGGFSGKDEKTYRVIWGY
mgnify:CR=1 FL=1